MSAWHYVQDGKGCGPVELPALQALLAGGALPPDSLVWQPGMPNWVPARALPELAASIPLSPPPGAPPPPPPFPPTASAAFAPADAADINANKLLAALAYIGPLVVVPLLGAPQSKFARFHCNQAIVLFLSFFVFYGGIWIFSIIPIFGCMLLPFHFAAWIAVFFLMILGAVNAAGGQYKELPWIGQYRVLH